MQSLDMLARFQLDEHNARVSRHLAERTLVRAVGMERSVSTPSPRRNVLPESNPAGQTAAAQRSA